MIITAASAENGYRNWKVISGPDEEYVSPPGNAQARNTPEPQFDPVRLREAGILSILMPDVGERPVE